MYAKKDRKYKLYKEHMILMHKITLKKIFILRTLQNISELLYIEKQISSSHHEEKIHEELVVVFKITVGPKHLYSTMNSYLKVHWMWDFKYISFIIIIKTIIVYR